MRRLPPLRIPRCLLDPRCQGLPPPDGEGLVPVVLEYAEGRITAIRAAPPRSLREGVLPESDLPERSLQERAFPSDALPLALTPLVEPHAHLDKAFSGDAFPNLEGTMAGALAANHREALQRSGALVLARAERALQLAWRYGLRAIRSHVDSLGPPAEASWEALGSLRRHWAARVELQLVALVPIRHWLTPEGEALARRVAAADGLLGGVLGAPFATGPADGEALMALLRLAERHGCGVDLHIDECETSPGRGVRLVSRLLQEHRISLPLTCSHASSMGLLPDRACQRLAESLAVAGVGVVALPTTNLWLLGRRSHRTPWRRPQAPIRQLQAAGVCVAIGADNVQDAWFPGGDFDPLALLRFAAVASHLVPWQRQGLSPFTTAAARLLDLAWDGVLRVGAPADLVVLGAASWQELLARPPQRRVLRGGTWLSPPEAESPSPLLAGLVG